MRRVRPQGGEGRGRPKQRRKGQARANLTFRRKASHATAQAQRPRARKGGNERGEGKHGWSGWKESDRPTTRTTNPRFNEGYPKMTVIKVTPASISQSPRPGPCQARTAHNFMCEAKCQLS